MDDHQAPGRALTAFEELGPTRQSTCGAPPPRARTTIPKAIHQAVAELGLRYRPTSGVDLEAHRGRLTLLAEDLADAPADLLRVAIVDHARTCRFMPTAAELVALMQAALDTRGAAAATADEREWAASFVGRRNVDLAMGAGGRSDIEWYRDEGGDPRLRPRPAPEREVAPIAPELVDERNAALARFGAPFRYDPAGKPMRGASSGH